MAVSVHLPFESARRCTRYVPDSGISRGGFRFIEKLRRPYPPATDRVCHIRGCRVLAGRVGIGRFVRERHTVIFQRRPKRTGLRDRHDQDMRAARGSGRRSFRWGSWPIRFRRAVFAQVALKPYEPEALASEFHMSYDHEAPESISWGAHSPACRARKRL